jgi:hypothetical protein
VGRAREAGGVLTGTADPGSLVAHVATMPGFDADALTLPDVEVLQALCEIRIGGRQASLPPGLHPTNPPSCVLQVWRCPESPWGSFHVAQARIGCRSGLRPRGLVHGCVVDSPAAATALRERWGFPAQPGTVSLRRGYDRVTAQVEIGGTAVLVFGGVDPEPLAPGDVAYTTTVTLADTPRGRRLVQVDTDVAPSRAERLRPRLDVFVTDGWVHASVEPSLPVSASIATAEVTLQRLRYVSRPDELAFTGTEPVGGA